jgi:hypothetical protein
MLKLQKKVWNEELFATYDIVIGSSKLFFKLEGAYCKLM